MQGRALWQLILHSCLGREASRPGRPRPAATLWSASHTTSSRWSRPRLRLLRPQHPPPW